MASPAQILLDGGVGVVPTDTLYGLVAAAKDPSAVARIFELKQRDSAKPLIVLIPSESSLAEFGIVPTETQSTILRKLWPGPISVILDCPREEFAHLHRGTHAVAFRMPALPTLRALLSRTGPLVAPSANPEGCPPAATIAEARAYFGDAVDFYEDGGTRSGLPSTLVRFSGAAVEVVRRGAGDIPLLPTAE